MSTQTTSERREIKWATVDSSDGERSLKQHAFIHAVRKVPYIGDEYNGNQALCNKRAGIMDENEQFVSFDNVDSEPQKDDCCKICKRLALELQPV